MSALPPKADIGTQSRNVRFVPKADIRNRFHCSQFHQSTNVAGVHLTASIYGHSGRNCSVKPDSAELGFCQSICRIDVVSSETRGCDPCQTTNVVLPTTHSKSPT